MNTTQCLSRVLSTRVEVLFSKYDANKDGVLDKKEAGTSPEDLGMQKALLLEASMTAIMTHNYDNKN